METENSVNEAFSKMLEVGEDKFEMYSEKNIKDMEIMNSNKVTVRTWKTDEEELAESRKHTHHYTTPAIDVERQEHTIETIRKLLQDSDFKAKHKEVPAEYFEELSLLKIKAEIFSSYNPDTAPVSWWHDDCSDQYLGRIYSPEQIQAHKEWKKDCLATYESNKQSNSNIQSINNESAPQIPIKKRSSSMSM